jgi:hypothetical protein
MTLVQLAGVSFVDVAILRFLLLGFMKAFQDRPCGPSGLSESAGASGERLVERVEQTRYFSVRGFVEHDVLPCADRESLRSFFFVPANRSRGADESDELARCHSIFQDGL